MVVNFNPALSFGTANVIPIKSSKSERVVNYIGNDSFAKANHADVAFGMKNVGSKAKLTLFAFLMSMFSGCVHVPEGNPNRLAEFYAKDAKGMFYALKDSITGGIKSKSATTGNIELSYTNWISSGTGEKYSYSIDPTTLKGTLTLNDGRDGVLPAVLKKSDSGHGIEFESFLNDRFFGSETWDLNGAVSESGLEWTASGEPGIVGKLSTTEAFDSLSAEVFKLTDGKLVKVKDSGLGKIEL